MDPDRKRIVELQSQVVDMRAALPKVYRKLMKIEYKHFVNNLRNGECQIPDHLQLQAGNVGDGESDQCATTMADCVRQLGDVPAASAAPSATSSEVVCRLATQLAQARRILQHAEAKQRERGGARALPPARQRQRTQPDEQPQQPTAEEKAPDPPTSGDKTNPPAE